MKSLEEEGKKGPVVFIQSPHLDISLKKATPPGGGIPTITEQSLATYNMYVSIIIRIYAHILTGWFREIETGT